MQISEKLLDTDKTRLIIFSEQRTANSEQRTANSEQRTANSEQRTANSEQRTANSERQDCAQPRTVAQAQPRATVHQPYAVHNRAPLHKPNRAPLHTSSCAVHNRALYTSSALKQHNFKSITQPIFSQAEMSRRSTQLYCCALLSVCPAQPAQPIEVYQS